VADSAWVTGGIMFAAIALIILAGKLPTGATTNAMDQAVNKNTPSTSTKKQNLDKALDNVLPSGLSIYNKQGQPIPMNRPRTEK
jgi:hypothetical protein